jgi:prepilin-type processing-associated H-X9-DG protein
MSRFLIVASLGSLLLLVLLGSRSDWLLDLVSALIFGWISYLIHVFPEVRVNGWGVATVLACLVPLAIGTRGFLGWFCGQSDRENGITGRLWRWTAWLLAMVVLMFVAGLAAGGIVHQAGWLLTAPESIVRAGSPQAQRSGSTFNLKQMGRALYNYHERFGTFPPGALFDPVGRPLHGWQSLILPYLEQQDLFDRINFNIPWDDPRNAEAFRTELGVYKNPEIHLTRDAAGYALSHYAGTVRMLGGDARHTLKDVTDGTQNTLMAGEVVSRFKPWGDPTNWRDPALGVNRSPDGFGGPFAVKGILVETAAGANDQPPDSQGRVFAGGANFLFVDGSVHFIKNSVNPRVLEALGTPKGGERVSAEQ